MLLSLLDAGTDSMLQANAAALMMRITLALLHHNHHMGCNNWHSRPEVDEAALHRYLPSHTLLHSPSFAIKPCVLNLQHHKQLLI